MGNPMGMMGKKPVSVTPNSAAELERTTGLEPATLTLAKKGNDSPPPRRLLSLEQAARRRLVRYSAESPPLGRALCNALNRAETLRAGARVAAGEVRQRSRVG
jgi:hypothetical protein